jgi:small GTP-binding protein
MSQKKQDFVYGIILLGNNDAGKTNFILRYVKNTYDSKTLRTIGIDFIVKFVTLFDGKKAKIRIFDTESTEHFKSIIRNHFRMMDGFIIMYNITRRESFENATNWLREIRDYKDNNNIAFVGNHVDVD